MSCAYLSALISSQSISYLPPPSPSYPSYLSSLSSSITLALACLHSRILLGLEVVDHGCSITDFEWVGPAVLLPVGLDKELLDLPVVNDGGIAPRALSKSALGIPRAGHSHATGEEAGTVR